MFTVAQTAARILWFAIAALTAVWAAVAVLEPMFNFHLLRP